jgi:hypothetical protein
MKISITPTPQTYSSGKLKLDHVCKSLIIAQSTWLRLKQIKIITAVIMSIFLIKVHL